MILSLDSVTSTKTGEGILKSSKILSLIENKFANIFAVFISPLFSTSTNGKRIRETLFLIFDRVSLSRVEF